MAEQTLVGRDRHLGPFDLVAGGLPASCQTASQTWAMAWAGMGLAEARWSLRRSG